MILSQIFFFQAEDGIRDGHVTGVQTCALPIYRKSASFVPAQGADHPLNNWQRARALTARSEERRVGKECRGGWWPKKRKKNEWKKKERESRRGTETRKRS